jgi:PKD repeat protein
MTMIQKPGVVGNLTPWGTMVHDVVQSNLGSDDWGNVFYHTEESVTKADFGTTDTGNPNLNDAAFHYHMGHGHEDWLLGTHTSWIPLSGWPLGLADLVEPKDVNKKWTDKNKWVFLDSCDVLIDKRWGGALNTSHGILGYSSYKWTSVKLPQIFFDNAITNNRPITQSYYIATKEAQTGPLATVIFDTPYQLFYDHLPGHGDIVADEDPDDNIIYFAEWNSGSGGGAGGRQQGSSVQPAIIQSAFGEVTLNTTLPSSPSEIPILAATVNSGDIIQSWSQDLMMEQHNVTSEVDAPQVALNILQTEGGGLPQGAVRSYVNTTYLLGYNTETGELFNSSPLLTSVQYRREIDGMPVGGRGGIIDISLGEDGKNLGLLKVWRTASILGSQKLIPADTAVEKLKNGELLEIPQDGINVTINDIKLGYFEKGADEQQEFFEPVWIFYGNLDLGESINLYVYARKFANFTATPLIGSTGDIIAFTDTSETKTIKWFWDFGDGTNSPLKNPTNAYQTGGNYTVTLTAWNDLGSDSLSRTEYIRIYPDPKPVAGFTSNYSWNNRVPPVAVSFIDTSIGYITNWSWDFGDGTNSTEQNPTHMFTLSPGEVDAFYTVNLTVTDCYGRTSMNYDWIYVEMDYHPNFTAEPPRGLAPLNVTFTDTSPVLNKIYMQIWYFGDGTYSEWYEDNGGIPQRTVFHEYTTDGNYSVQLAISPIYHMEVPYYSIKEDLIHVGDVFPLDAEFTANQTTGKAPLAVDFTDQSPGSPVSWLWSFGDGTTATDQNPVHVYTTVGTYSVSLVVTNPDGSNTKMKTNYITILPVTGTVQAGVRIEPETLNLKSKGTFTAFITLPTGYDVNNIDLASLVCEGAHAKSGHATGEGSNMYIAKFNRQDLTGVFLGDAVTFIVTGNVITNGDSIDFEGSDTIRVI